MDIAQYVGIPFVDRGRDRTGCDCWGLVKLVLAEQFGIDAQDYGTSCDEHEANARTMSEEAQASLWDRVALPKSGDVILLRRQGIACHVGIIVGPGQMLHTEKTRGAVVESFMRPHWRSRIEGFYRYHCS
jgi:cell wall-associated NlpC family hydrolase